MELVSSFPPYLITIRCRRGALKVTPVPVLQNRALHVAPFFPVTWLTRGKNERLLESRPRRSDDPGGIAARFEFDWRLKEVGELGCGGGIE